MAVKVTLSDEAEAQINQAIETGRFEDATAVVEAAIHAFCSGEPDTPGYAVAFGDAIAAFESDGDDQRPGVLDFLANVEHAHR